MGIANIKVSIQSTTPANVACGPAGGISRVAVKVSGAADAAAGGRYDVALYHARRLRADVLLVSNTNNRVGAGKKFNKTITFQLICNRKCEVAGVKGSSGEQMASIYAYAQEPGGVSDSSQTTPVSCVPPEDEDPGPGSMGGRSRQQQRFPTKTSRGKPRLVKPARKARRA